MGYDPKAVLIRKEHKTMANGDKFFLKLIKRCLENSNRQSSYRKSDSGK